MGSMGCCYGWFFQFSLLFTIRIRQGHVPDRLRSMFCVDNRIMSQLLPFYPRIDACWLNSRSIITLNVFMSWVNLDRYDTNSTKHCFLRGMTIHFPPHHSNSFIQVETLCDNYLNGIDDGFLMRLASYHLCKLAPMFC